MMRYSRSAVLVSIASTTLALAFPLVMPACSSADAPAPSTTGDDDASVQGDVLQPPPITRTQSETALAAQRNACAFKAGAWPAETIGTDYPVGADIPINHVIVIMQENRSFDHYLGRLVAQGYYKAGDFSEGYAPPGTGTDSDAGADADADAGAGADAGPDTDADTDAATDAGANAPPEAGPALRGSGFDHSDQLDGPPAGWSNPDTDGTRIVPHPDDQYCYGVDHSWDGMHNDLNGGKLDGFVKQNNPGGAKTFFYEDDTVIPFYYALANTFSVGDRYFASVLGPTWPNRYFLMAGTSYGINDNSFAVNDTQANPAVQIFSRLEAGGHTWKDYTDGPHMIAFFPNFGFQPETRDHMGTIKCTLFADIANGTLPDVSMVMGDEVGETSDEGPSALPGIGGQLVETIVRAVMASSSWKDTAIFITYDENGGLADHVRPAPACAPDGLAPHDGTNKAFPGAFDTTGFRVPFIVVSPYARAHYASHVVHDHSSIARFIETRFGLPAMTGRDANATPPLEMFDFKNPPFMTPPNIDAKTTVPQAILTKCGQSLAPLTCTSSN